MTGLTVLATIPRTQSGESEPLRESALPEALRELAGRPSWEEQPICWSLPSALLADRSSTTAAACREMIAERVADRIYPAGLLGAPHQLLLVEESIAEIQWSITNIWGTGVADAGFDAELIILHQADIARASQRKLCTRSRPHAVLRGQLGALPALVWYDSDRWRGIPVVAAGALDGLAAKAAVRAIDHERRLARKTVEHGGGAPSHVVLEIDLTGPDASALWKSALDAAEEWTRHSWSSLGPLPLPESWPRCSREVGVGADYVPRSLDALLDAAKLRKRRASKINQRRILASLSNDTPARDPESGEPPAPCDSQREFVASMMGEATLAGTRIDALFSAGRFVGFDPADRESAEAARSLLETKDVRDEFVATTCFSFESDGSRGLRTIEQLQSEADQTPAWRIVTDYSLIGEIDCLVVGAALEGPPGTDSSSVLTHLAVPLPGDGPIAVHSAYPDGSGADTVLTQGGLTVASGAQISVESPFGLITMAFLSRDGHPHIGSVRLIAGRRLLLALGGAIKVGGEEKTPVSMVRTMLIGSGERGREEIVSILRGRLPQTLIREVARGPIPSRQTRVEQPEG